MLLSSDFLKSISLTITGHTPDSFWCIIYVSPFDKGVVSIKTSNPKRRDLKYAHKAFISYIQLHPHSNNCPWKLNITKT